MTWAIYMRQCSKNRLVLRDPSSWGSQKNQHFSPQIIPIPETSLAARRNMEGYSMETHECIYNTHVALSPV